MSVRTQVVAKCDKASYLVSLSPLSRAWLDEQRMRLLDVANDCHRFHAHKESSEKLGALLTSTCERTPRTLDAVREYIGAVQSSTPRPRKL